MRCIWFYDCADFTEVNNHLLSLDWSDIDFTEVNNHLLSLDWSDISSAPNIDGAWSNRLKNVYTVALREIPSKIVDTSRAAGGRPWINKALRDLIKRKCLAWRKLKREPSPVNLMDFRDGQNKVTSGLRRAEQQYVLSLQRNSRNGKASKPFWCNVKHMIGSKNVSQIPDLEIILPDDTRRLLQDNLEKADFSTDSLLK